MSFASKIKNSLCKLQTSRCCRTAELAGIVCFSASLQAGQLKIKTEHESVAQRVVALLSDILDEGEFVCEAPKRLSGWHIVTVLGQSAVENLADALSMYQNGDITLCPADAVYMSSCCRTAFMRGAFLGGGSMSDPEKNYHLEFVTKTAVLADRLYELLQDASLPAKITVRKNSFVVYIKDSEAIASFLGLAGASGPMMEFYNIKIEHELRNNVNRQVNCDNANLDKITAAAGRQIDAIKKIQGSIGFDNLPPVLGEMAHLRLQNPEMSLVELGTLIDPPIGKSGVNHRLARICQIADTL